jgi:hypothetical protein
MLAPEMVNPARDVEEGLGNQARSCSALQHLLSIIAATPAPITASDGSSGNISTM